jgi:ZIP family zinc transporter
LPCQCFGKNADGKFHVWAIFRIGRPIAAVLGAFAVTFFTNFTPCFGFCGSMIFVVVEEVIPETQQDNNTSPRWDSVGDLLL